VPIGCSGGSVVTSNSQGVAIPADALTDEVTIIVDELDPADAPSPPSGKMVVGVPISLQPHGQTFLTPVDVVLSYAGVDLGPLSPQSLGIWAYDDDLQTWTGVGGVVDEELNLVTASSDHFSLYAIMAPLSAVGGIAELPDMSRPPGSESGSSARNNVAFVAGLAAALAVLTAGAWYTRRRWLG